MQRIDYKIEERNTLFAQLRAAGKVVAEDVTIDLDANGIPRTCYCIIEDAQPDLLAEADARILELEYQNIILREGLA